MPVAPQVEEVDVHSRFDVLQYLASNVPVEALTATSVQAAPVNSKF